MRVVCPVVAMSGPITPQSPLAVVRGDAGHVLPEPAAVPAVPDNLAVIDPVCELADYAHAVTAQRTVFTLQSHF